MKLKHMGNSVYALISARMRTEYGISAEGHYTEKYEFDGANWKLTLTGIQSRGQPVIKVGQYSQTAQKILEVMNGAPKTLLVIGQIILATYSSKQRERKSVIIRSAMHELTTGGLIKIKNEVAYPQ